MNDGEIQATGGVARKSAFRRFAEYPLVTLIVAGFIFVATIGITGAIFEILFRQGALERDLIIQNVAMTIAAYAMYKLVIRRLGAHPRDEMQATGAVRDTAIGLAVGFGLFASIVGVAAILGVYRVVGWGDFGGVGLALVSAGLFPAVSEEIMFRGILFRWIEEFGGSWLALALTSILFGAAHLLNPNASWFAATGIALEAGIMLGAAYMVTRSLWLPIGLHAAWNLTQGLIFDIPVSGLDSRGIIDARLEGPPLLTGGGFGLEASLIAMVIATAFGLYMLYRAHLAGQFVKPIWSRRAAAA